MPAEDAIFFDQIGHGLVLPLVEPADSAAKSQRRDVALSTAGKSIPLSDLRALKTLGRAMRTLRGSWAETIVDIAEGFTARNRQALDTVRSHR